MHSCCQDIGFMKNQFGLIFEITQSVYFTFCDLRIICFNRRTPIIWVCRRKNDYYFVLGKNQLRK
jgi:hypothetical protein